ncbi:hypothetical protein G4B88_018690 [Cannabis sativa]|uniref:Uncharacterized protein n=1 Tax=Cannabis sativa TaxID=3483 RepID=A0A7J6I039_CANSA|nr:hypothetical protein G4B88_018690 [Cannabis sativa]
MDDPICKDHDLELFDHLSPRKSERLNLLSHGFFKQQGVGSTIQSNDIEHNRVGYFFVKLCSISYVEILPRSLLLGKESVRIKFFEEHIERKLNLNVSLNIQYDSIRSKREKQMIIHLLLEEIEELFGDPARSIHSGFESY